MPKDPLYSPAPFIYKSRGLSARPATDQVPPDAYLNLMNCQERQENSMSSRFGTVIINRDPDGTVGGQNYFFSSPVTSLGRMLYQGNTWRYAGIQGGQLYRRAGDTQGQYTQIQSGLSGAPFQSVITNCFQSSQPYFFVYDSAMSIKDSGTGFPTLTGIDPSPYTLNTLPYSPLLSLIDSFASTNSYTTSGFSVAWAFTSVVTLTSTGGQMVTDFPEFFGIQIFGSTTYSLAGSTVATSATAPSSNSNSAIYSGFPSTSVPAGDIVSIAVPVTLTFNGNNPPSNVANYSFELQYSTDGGSTWTTFFSLSGVPSYTGVVPQSIPHVTNLDNVQIQVLESITSSAGTNTVSAIIGTIEAVITAPNIFGPVVNGMLSTTSNTAPNVIPIISVQSITLVNGVYTQLLVTTQSAHGLTGGNPTSIYASSNDLADGFYTVASAPSSTTFVVPFISPVAISATGGQCFSGVVFPEVAVLANLYSTPYPPQMSVWGFYVPASPGSATFPVGSWQGTVAQNSTATVGNTISLDLNQNNQVTDDDLIVMVIKVGNPAAISSIRLQFDVASSGYTSSYYYKDVTPTFFQQGVQELQDPYTTTEQQIFADAIGLLTGQVPNSTTSQLQPSNISTGQGTWLTIYMRRGDFVPIGSAGESGLDWTSVTGWQVLVNTNTVGSTTVALNGIYLQWGFGPSSFGGAGYDYRQTYFNALTGTESNACPIQQFNEQFGYLASLAQPFYLRQATKSIGQYSDDPQVTHVRMYRRGGTFSDTWHLLDQFPNVTGNTQFAYKDVIPDAVLAQAKPLVLDNDPPVTSSLQTPIATTLSAATSAPGLTIYSPFAPQLITVTNAAANFVPNQIVQVGLPSNLEEVRVINGGTGKFTAIVRLQHNAGEPVNVYSIPRVTCSLCALAYNQVWLAGDPNNPHYLYFSKPGYPESFGPQNYIPVGSPSDAINQVVNWRGTLFVQTLTTWYIIVGGAQPYAQPTGSKHGGIARRGVTQTESAIWYRSADGQRQFQGADGAYTTLPIELLYRPGSVGFTPLPLTDPTQTSQDVIAYYNNEVFCSYISTTNGGQRYRLVWHTLYQRWRIDDISATAMLWEQDTNTLVVGKQIAPRQYAIVQDQINDYDDGGWNSSGVLVKIPINMTLQTPFQDLAKPHYPKQWNVLESDVNSSAQPMTTTLFFNTEPQVPLVLPSFTTSQRNKVQQTISPAGAPPASGVEAFAMSIQQQVSVTVAPVLYQENIYAALLADFRQSHDTYWLNLSTDESKIIKQGYWDYTSSAPITVNLYADGSTIPYFTFTLPANPKRAVVRVLFPAWKPRLWRAISTSTADFQFWNAPKVEWKGVCSGKTYVQTDLQVGS